MASFFTSFRDSLRYAPCVYRLIDAALIGNFFDYPLLYSNRNFSDAYTIVTEMQQRVKQVLRLNFNRTLVYIFYSEFEKSSYIQQIVEFIVYSRAVEHIKK